MENTLRNLNIKVLIIDALVNLYLSSKKVDSHLSSQANLISFLVNLVNSATIQEKFSTKRQ